MQLSPNMIEATRLTRAGRLQEAMALLQGAAAPPAATAPDAPNPSAWRMGKAMEGVMEGLGPILDLKAERVAPKAGNGPDATLPQGAVFAAGRFDGPHGGRDYKLYVPASGSGAPRPLVVMLHGCTQDAADFARGTAMNALAEAEGFLVLYPEQDRSANMQGCWNWFEAKDQARGQGEPEIVAGMVGHVIAERGVDPKRVYVAGLSAGGAMAAILGQTYPDLFAAVGVHSGLAAGSARDMGSAFAAMRGGGAGAAGVPVPTIVFHGDADKTVSPKNGADVAAQAGAGGLHAVETVVRGEGARPHRRVRYADKAGEVQVEHVTVEGAGHAWAGGSSAGSHTDPKGPDASAAMWGFFKGRTLG